MMKKLVAWGLTSLASALTFVATSGFSVNSVIKDYEPDLPSSLKR